MRWNGLEARLCLKLFAAPRANDSEGQSHPNWGPLGDQLRVLHAACFGPRALLGTGIGDHFQNLNTKHKSLHGEALPFASIGTLVMERLAALNKVFGHRAALQHY